MFLIERSVSLLAFAAAMFSACVLLGAAVRKQWTGVLCFYLLVLTGFAYLYKPYITADLYRLREYVQYWTPLTWKELLSFGIRMEFPGWVVYSYILCLPGDINLLQTVSCLWCFSNIFYIIAHEIRDHQLHGFCRSLMLFFVMSVGTIFLQAVSGIRSMLGITIVSVLFYRETIRGRNLLPHLPLYLFAALLHAASMILVISRMLFLLFQFKSPAKRFLILLLVGVLGVLALIYMRGSLYRTYESGIWYLSGGEEYFYVWEVIIGLLETAETLYVIRAFRRACPAGEMTDGIRQTILMCVIWTLISVLMLPFSYAIFRRYTMFCTITVLPVLAGMLRYEQDGTSRTRAVQVVFLLSLMIFMISLIRGDLCGYTFFTL